MLEYLTLSLQAAADNLCKQFGSRPGPTKCRPWSGSKPLIAHSDSVGERKEILGKVNFVKLKHDAKL